MQNFVQRNNFKLPFFNNTPSQKWLGHTLFCHGFRLEVIKYNRNLFEKSKRSDGDRETRGLQVATCANFNSDRNWNSNNEHLDNSNDNGRMAQPARKIKMENLYKKIYSFGNLFLAWKKARKGKTLRAHVIKFEENLEKNLLDLQLELKNQFYKPLPLKTFILRDPKTRKISKSDFRDRIVHHALVNIIEPIFDKTFIYDSCANQKGKGTLFTIKRFDKFCKKVSKNFHQSCFILKADIKHYFEEVDHEILLNILHRKIADEKVLWLIKQILNNNRTFAFRERERVTSVVKTKECLSEI